MGRELPLAPVLLLLSFSCSCVHGETPPAAQIAQSAAGVPAKKRAAPEPVEPVVIQGIRYEAVPWGRARGLDQNGGYVQAVDVATGKQLWLVRVYKITYDPAMEADKQDEFISELSASKDGRTLTVVTERGSRYRIDLATRTVTH